MEGSRTKIRPVTAVVLSLAFAFGTALILIAVFGSKTGRDQSALPAEIEAIQPSRGDKVLSQANIVADLVAGYGGRLEIDFQPLATANTQEAQPTGQVTGATGGAATPTTPPPTDLDPNAVRFDAGSNILSFQPRPGADLERFSVGRHFVKVIYWKLTEGEANSFSYTWYFDVTA